MAAVVDFDPPTESSGNWDKCPRCQAVLFPGEDSVCRDCGYTIVPYAAAALPDCPECGAKLTSEDVFCPDCGQKVAAPLTDRSKAVLAGVAMKKRVMAINIVAAVILYLLGALGRSF